MPSLESLSSSKTMDKLIQSPSLLDLSAADQVVLQSDAIPVSAPSTPTRIVSSSSESSDFEDDESEPRSPPPPPLSSSKKRKAATNRDGELPFSPSFLNDSAVITPIKPASVSKMSVQNGVKPLAARRLLFGRGGPRPDSIQPNVKTVYNIVRKLTGTLGGNGYSGPIYGELTQGSMQKMIDAMVRHTDLDSSSRFIDVGSGIGKPNLHVAQSPGVAFSCGVELERVRWSLGMTCLKGVLNAALKERSRPNFVDDGKSSIQGRTMFLHRNIMEADRFDPFTHVYMFSIGFPPPLWDHLSNMWNSSKSEYLICYHSPKNIIDKYEFNVDLLAQLPTSMHGSSEGHMGYIYRRTGARKKTKKVPCDPIFAKAWKLAQGDIRDLHADVCAQMDDSMRSGPTTRSRMRGVMTRD